MEEIAKAIKAASLGIAAVRIMEIAQKLIIAATAALCGFFAVRLWRK